MKHKNGIALIVYHTVTSQTLFFHKSCWHAAPFKKKHKSPTKAIIKKSFPSSCLSQISWRNFFYYVCCKNYFPLSHKKISLRHYANSKIGLSSFWKTFFRSLSCHFHLIWVWVFIAFERWLFCFMFDVESFEC